MTHASGERPIDAPGVPAEEGIDLSDADEQLAESPEEKTSTDGTNALD